MVEGGFPDEWAHELAKGRTWMRNTENYIYRYRTHYLFNNVFKVSTEMPWLLFETICDQEPPMGGQHTNTFNYPYGPKLGHSCNECQEGRMTIIPATRYWEGKYIHYNPKSEPSAPLYFGIPMAHLGANQMIEIIESGGLSLSINDKKRIIGMWEVLHGIKWNAMWGYIDLTNRFINWTGKSPFTLK